MGRKVSETNKKQLSSLKKVSENEKNRVIATLSNIKYFPDSCHKC